MIAIVGACHIIVRKIYPGAYPGVGACPGDYSNVADDPDVYYPERNDIPGICMVLTILYDYILVTYLFIDRGAANI